MSSITFSLEQQFTFKTWENYIRNLSHEETQELLLLAIRQASLIDRPEEKLTLQNLENHVHSLNKKKAQEIIIQAIRLHLLE